MAYKLNSHRLIQFMMLTLVSVSGQLTFGQALTNDGGVTLTPPSQAFSQSIVGASKAWLVKEVKVHFQYSAITVQLDSQLSATCRIPGGFQIKSSYPVVGFNLGKLNCGNPDFDFYHEMLSDLVSHLVIETESSAASDYVSLSSQRSGPSEIDKNYIDAGGVFSSGKTRLNGSVTGFRISPRPAGAGAGTGEFTYSIQMDLQEGATDTLEIKYLSHTKRLDQNVHIDVVAILTPAN